MSPGRGHPDETVRYLGFDPCGEVFVQGGKIYRGIYPGFGDRCGDILDECERHNLFQYGIVPTRPAEFTPRFRNYERVLQHQRIPFATYPHEWPASMLKDAALFHIDLLDQLGEHDLTLKDWHPWNILFDATRPVFVDFTSITPTNELVHEEHLRDCSPSWLFSRLWTEYDNAFYAMFHRMCVPYFLFPLYMLRRKGPAAARRRVFETTLNSGNGSISLSEVFPIFSPRWVRYGVRVLRRKFALAEAGARKHKFLSLLRREVESLAVAQKFSDYSDYYTAKSEDFPLEPVREWTNKQRVIYEAIQHFRPATVLDAASNTGWFSRLAARLGCKVVAFDTDEACMDILYRRAKTEEADILPLVMDIMRPTPELPPMPWDDHSGNRHREDNAPLLRPATERLRCEMALALGIIHHLALGLGKGFDDILTSLGKFADRYLLVEFIAKDDPLIVAEPKYFPAYSANPDRFDWYDQGQFVERLQNHFSRVGIERSYPPSRSIAICER